MTASPLRDPALLAEWSLLSSCIGDMEESDLMAFDEDLDVGKLEGDEDEDLVAPDGARATLAAGAAALERAARV
jgi:hypothetical protein